MLFRLIKLCKSHNFKTKPLVENKGQFMKIASLILMLLIAGNVLSQEKIKKNYSAKKLQDNGISIDGKFDETIWATANWEDSFIQHEPVEGAAPHRQTEFALLYDENNIYVAIKSLDSPDSISRRMTRTIP